jgi:hypothetical protein
MAHRRVQLETRSSGLPEGLQFYTNGELVALQGGYYGFRSRVADGRFLQARRKRGELSFHNQNFGEPYPARHLLLPVNNPQIT